MGDSLRFNPLPHAEGDSTATAAAGRYSKFQSTPSRRGRHNSKLSFQSLVCFNPLPHAEGDKIITFPKLRFEVSIHSLTQRETMVCCKYSLTPMVSIHSLTQRETLYRISGKNLQSMFQSTPSRRGRQKLQSNILTAIYVSIHSLTQRETFVQRPIKPAVACFNPLPHAEGDRLWHLVLLNLYSFNPLPHAEGDGWIWKVHFFQRSFNPLPHAEGDDKTRSLVKLL